MSGLHDGAPDPLAALRASDRRPRVEVLRERVFANGAQWFAATAGRVAVGVLVCALAIGVGWRLFVESEPPVEASIPFASGAVEEATQPGSQDSPAVAAEAGPLPTSGLDSGSAPTSVDVEAVEPLTDVVVHVAGAVSRPGLIRGDSSWRIDDAVRAAGGPANTADLDRINLAAPVLDGQRIFVPHVDEEVPLAVDPEPAGAAGETGGASAPIDLNTSDAIDLQSLPGVGPATAAAIVSHREDFGSFGTVDALVAVPGIGPATLESLRDHVRV